MSTQLLFLVLLCSAVSCSQRDDYQLFSDDVFKGREVPDLCLDYFKSRSAKLRLDNVDREVAQDALESEKRNGVQYHERDNYQKMHSSVLEQLVEKKYSNHICDAAEFAPTLLAARHELTCIQICHRCVPGSIPICFLRSPHFTQVAQVCLCTYDRLDPVARAALSLRHEKRIFSRRI